jgi:hypothetical protein
MHINCRCGATIYDQSDGLPFKAHVISDEDWFNLLEAIDDAVEKSGRSSADKERAAMGIRASLGTLSRMAWQCTKCGRVYIDDRSHVARELTPASNDVPKDLFGTRTLAD